MEGHTGSGYHSDIAIDDLSVTHGHCWFHVFCITCFIKIVKNIYISYSFCTISYQFWFIEANVLGFLKHQREAGNIQHNDWSMRFRFTDVYLTLHQPRRGAFSWNKSLCMGKVECSNPGSDTHMSLKQVVTVPLTNPTRQVWISRGPRKWL